MDFFGKKCPVCSVAFKEGDDVVVCPKCGAPYHRDCYTEKGKCIFPSLHKKGEAWKSPEDDIPDKPLETEDSFICRRCGHKNSKDSIICEKCGSFLSGSFDINDNNSKKNDAPEIDPDIFPGSVFFAGSINDPENEFGRDDDFEGVRSGDLIDYTGVNAIYYLPIFHRIKKTGSSKFNFAAFILGGPWYFFRKQYVKGIIYTLLFAATRIGENIISYFWANDLWKNAQEAIAGPGARVNYVQYYNWIIQNYSIQQMLIMCLPGLFGLLTWVLMFICGFTANRGYYKKSLKAVKAIRKKNPDIGEDEMRKKIAAKGGTHFGAAFLITVCSLILYGAFLYFLTTIK